MTVNVRQSIMQELQGLPDDRLPDVLEYVRFLRLRAFSGEDIDRRFDAAVATARSIAQHENIRDIDIEAEIADVRAGR